MWCSVAAYHKETKHPACPPVPSCPSEQGSARKKTKGSKAPAEVKQLDTVLLCISFKK